MPSLLMTYVIHQLIITYQQDIGRRHYCIFTSSSTTKIIEFINFISFIIITYIHMYIQTNMIYIYIYMQVYAGTSFAACHILTHTQTHTRNSCANQMTAALLCLFAFVFTVFPLYIARRSEASPALRLHLHA